MDPEKLFTTREAAEVIGVHPKTLYAWAESHQIGHVRIGAGRSIRFRRIDIEDYLSRRAVAPR
jgi:excisionase family DNA binding protein